MSSRIAKNPVIIPNGVIVNLAQQSLAVEGPKGKLSMPIHPSVELEFDESGEQKQLKVKSIANESKTDISMPGTTRALVANMVHGVSVGFEKQLELIGVGYRAQVQGRKLMLSLGFSHPVEVNIPEGINVEAPSNTLLKITSHDKQALGQFASVIREFRPPEPYKGKGIRFVGEIVRRKETKKK